MTFFQRHPIFSETSKTGSGFERLDVRYEAIIDWNREILQGASVLDIASHDGRWSLAALDAGARHLVGIEARPELVANAKANLTNNGMAGRFEYRVGDALEELRRDPPQVDVVLLLGFLYHVHQTVELAKLVIATGARRIVIDTLITPDKYVHQFRPNILTLSSDNMALEGAQAFSDVPGGSTAIICLPSRSALAFIFDHLGFNTEEFAWGPVLDRVTTDQVWDYRDGIRTTYRMTRREPQPLRT